MIMLAFLTSEATPFSQGAKENEKADSRRTWCSQDHNMVSPGSWAGLAPCLFERQRSSPSWVVVVSHSWANERCTVILLCLGPSYCFWSWMDIRRGTPASSHLCLSSSLRQPRRGSEERGDGFPEIAQFPAFTAGEQCVECLYSHLLKLHRQ